MDGKYNNSNHSKSSTSKRYNEEHSGFDYGKIGVPESMPNQSLNSIPRGLPSESPESLLSEANRNAKRVGDDSKM